MKCVDNLDEVYESAYSITLQQSWVLTLKKKNFYNLC